MLRQQSSLAAAVISYVRQHYSISDKRQNGNIYSMKARKSAPKVSTSQRKKWLTLLQNYAEPVAPTGSANKPASYRIVVDTNVLISAFIYGGTPAKVLEDIIASHTLVLSDHIVDELIAYLRIIRPKIPQKWLRALREQLQRHCYEYDVDFDIDSRDPKDNLVIALAVTQGAFIISGDKDLLEYNSNAPVVILSTGEYKELFL